MEEVLHEVIITLCDGSCAEADLFIRLLAFLQTENTVVLVSGEREDNLMPDILLSQYPHGVDHQFPEFLFCHFHCLLPSRSVGLMKKRTFPGRELAI
jgi:hypothetical protein